MCDHFLGLHRYQQARQPKAVWRCGTCGRESYRPVDCCVQPYFAPKQQPSLVGSLVTWAGAAAIRACTGVAAFFRRRLPTEHVTEQPTHVQPVHVVVEKEAFDKSEVEDTTPVSV